MTRPLLRWGTYLAPNMNEVHTRVAGWAAGRLDLELEFTVESDYRRLRDGAVDLAWVCGLPYVTIADRHPGWVRPIVAPVLSPPRYAGRPVYFSDIIVREEGDAQSFDDLRGRVFGFNEEPSHSGFGVVRAHLAGLGEDLSFFGSTVRLGFHQTAIDAVASGEVDAAAIDSQTLTVELRERPELNAKIRVVAELGPSPIQPLAATNEADLEIVERLAALLVKAHEDPALEDALRFGIIDRFVDVKDRDYDPIRRMRDSAEAMSSTVEVTS